MLPDSDRLAEEPNTGRAPASTWRAISSWNWPAFSSMSRVPALLEDCSTNGSTRCSSGWSARNGATTENGSPTASTSSRTMACLSASMRCSSALMAKLPNIPLGFS